MRRFIIRMLDAFKKGDLVLLLLCLIASAFSCLMVASTTTATSTGPLRYLLVQIGATGAGVFLYVWMSSIDTEWFSERRRSLVVFNVILLLLLLTPFGRSGGGNRSWLRFPFLPFDIQPAEICKITYVLIMASVMTARQNNLSSVTSVMQMVAHLGILMGLNIFVSRDVGVSLIFAFIFVGMALTGGVHWVWFAAAIGGLAIAAPIVWGIMPDDMYLKERIAVLFNPELDAAGTGARYQTVRALRSLTGGGLTGQGLFQGHRTQTNGALFAQHTDFIFSAIGEELGFVGCFLVVVLLFLIVARCIWVGIRSQDMLRRLVCFGVASALIFQIVINIGMNIGVMPVIGLTLPFISYGGSSIITLYAMLGLVSGVFAHPQATSHERYIRPPTNTLENYMQ